VISADYSSIWTEFVAELSRRGYTEGTNIVFEKRVVPPDRLGELNHVAGELAKANVDVIYTGSFRSAFAAKRATSTIPIVFAGAADPVAMGLVRNLSRPEGNLTGGSIQELDTSARELQLLAEASGKLTRFAHLMPRSFPLPPALSTTIINTANALGIHHEFVHYESDQELGPLVERLVREGVDGVAVTPVTLSAAYRKLAELLIKLRLPSIGNPSAGYLLSYGVSSPAVARLAAKQVDQILKGAKPADIPVEQVSTFELEINVRTAKAIGLSIPSSVLLQATRLLE